MSRQWMDTQIDLWQFTNINSSLPRLIDLLALLMANYDAMSVGYGSGVLLLSEFGS